MRTTKLRPATPLADAIEVALRPKFTLDERHWLNRIETIRRRLLADHSSIEVADFGAGDPSIPLTQEQMHEGVVTTETVADVSKASKPKFWASVLFSLMRTFKPTSALELGSCVGISAAYQAAAMKLNGDGKLVTMEGAPAVAAIAEKTLNSLGLDNASVVTGRFSDNLDMVLADLEPLDYVFIDGHHDETATVAYFDQILPHLTTNALVVLDDISWSDGMQNAWHIVRAHDRVAVSLDLSAIGICILGDPSDEKHTFKIKMR